MFVHFHPSPRFFTVSNTSPDPFGDIFFPSLSKSLSGRTANIPILNPDRWLNSEHLQIFQRSLRKRCQKIGFGANFPQSVTSLFPPDPFLVTPAQSDGFSHLLSATKKSRKQVDGGWKGLWAMQLEFSSSLQPLFGCFINHNGFYRSKALQSNEAILQNAPAEIKSEIKKHFWLLQPVAGFAFSASDVSPSEYFTRNTGWKSLIFDCLHTWAWSRSSTSNKLGHIELLLLGSKNPGKPAPKPIIKPTWTSSSSANKGLNQNQAFKDEEEEGDESLQGTMKPIASTMMKKLKIQMQKPWDLDASPALRPIALVLSNQLQVPNRFKG